MKPKILVLCTGNSCRSQIAEGYLQHFIQNKAEVYSAGIEAHGVHPIAIATMQEDGIDISKQTSNILDEYINMEFDFIITVCDHAKERCPTLPKKAKKFHFNFPDPAKAKGSDDDISKKFQVVRDEIKKYCLDFVREQL